MTPMRLRVTGGPSPRNVKVLVDGTPQESVSKIEIVADVSDAVRATITRIASVEFDGEATITNVFAVRLSTRRAMPGGEEGDVVWVTTHTGTGASRGDALRDLAGQLDAEEREHVSGQ